VKNRLALIGVGVLGVGGVAALLLVLGGSSAPGEATPAIYLTRSRAHPTQAAPTNRRRRRPVVRRAARVPALAGKPALGRAFAIVRLRPGARVALWRTPDRGFVRTLGPRTGFGSPVVLSVVKQRGGWLGVSTPALPNDKIGWVRREPRREQVYWTRYSLHVELAARRLSLLYGRRTVNRFLVTVGAPGSETPLGRFAITDALNFGESPYYGCCALALSARQTKPLPGWSGGKRIAIHGSPDPVGGAESLGCIQATDRTMRLLFRSIPLGTPVFVRE
jgi:hypothetical protein